jgi:hypothetical protein
MQRGQKVDVLIQSGKKMLQPSKTTGDIHTSLDSVAASNPCALSPRPASQRMASLSSVFFPSTYHHRVLICPANAVNQVSRGPTRAERRGYRLKF